jgi:hypothetical protein
MTNEEGRLPVLMTELDAAIGFLIGFVTLFKWSTLTPADYTHVVEALPQHVRDEIDGRCAGRGFPTAYEDQPWEYAHDIVEIAMDLVDTLQERLN